MPYATLDQLKKRYSERVLIDLTDREPPLTGAIVVPVVDQALTDTDALIDGYLAGRYKLPLVETPPILADLAQMIAIYKLHVFAPDPKIEKDYELSLRQLDKIASGVIRLNVEGVEPAASGSEGVQFIDRSRDMTPENLEGFI